ncbi:MAG: AI-2E family transporter [Anaerolineales bacterium]|nr:AI-2E family transporter [Anaerolineales bacterium]
MASTLTVIAFVLLLVIPTYLLVRVTIAQLSELLGELATFNVEQISSSIENALDPLPFDLFPIVEDGLLEEGTLLSGVQTAARSLAGWLADVLINIGTSLPMLITQVIIFIVLVVTLLPIFEDLVKRFQELSPLGNEISELYVRKTSAIVSSLVVGVFLIAVIQGFVMGIFYRLAGIPYAFLFTLLSMVFAMLPVVGISFMVIPMAIILFISGQTTEALIVLVGFYGVVNWIDVLLRPRLIAKEAYLNFTLVLLGILGGLYWAGYLGLFYGPVILLLLVTTINIYSERFAKGILLQSIR